RSSVASLTATAALLGAMAWLQPATLGIGVVLGLGIVHAHVGNIRRLIAGDEAAILRPVRWGRSKEADGTDASAVLAHGPAGAAVAAPALWREREAAPEADASEEAADAPDADADEVSSSAPSSG
ncbi:MAG: hypothetical protein H6733_16360, partial [Alphaproteobacteria bacterium]|nr:hypothetical protein [Alphaproteobacteria bacterium]